jgi:hypothetical protein
MLDDDLKPLGKHGGLRPAAGQPKKGERKNQRDKKTMP